MRKTVELDAVDSYRLYHIICAYLDSNRDPILVDSKEPARDIAGRVQIGPTALELSPREYESILDVFRMSSRIETPIELNRHERRALEDPILELGPVDEWTDTDTHRYYGANWGEVRTTVLNEYGHECERCSMTSKEHKEKFDRGLHIHHITPFRKFDSKEKANRKENLKPLCSICHTIEER